MTTYLGKFFKNKLKIFIICIISFIVLLSVGRAFQQAQIISFDFHFSPAKLVSEGINHYEYILEGKHDYGPNDKIMYEQNGVYAQGLFVLSCLWPSHKRTIHHIVANTFPVYFQIYFYFLQS